MVEICFRKNFQQCLSKYTTFFFSAGLLCCLASVIVKQEGQTATFHAKTTGHVFSYRWNFTQNNETEEVIRVEEGIIKFKGTRFKDRLQTKNCINHDFKPNS